MGVYQNNRCLRGACGIKVFPGRIGIGVLENYYEESTND